jgi:hypothetical protein
VFRLRACPAPRYRGPPRHQLRSLPVVCRARPPAGRRPRPAAEGIRPPDPMISSSRDITEKFRRREEGCDNAARGRICAVTWAFSIRLGAWSGRPPWTRGPALTLAAAIRPFRLRVESSLSSIHGLAG